MKILGRYASRLWAKRPKSRRAILLTVILLLAGLLAIYWSLFRGKGRFTTATGVLVLEDCDPDFSKPPFEDAVVMFGADGKPVRKVNGLNICETVGSGRALSVSPDGKFFTVCENVGDKLTAYQLSTGAPLWSLKGKFTSATVAPDDLVYALTSGDPIPGEIYGKHIMAIDQTGHIVRQAEVGGFDLAVDAERNAIWTVGKNIKKCDLELKIIFKLEVVGWCAVSVDYDRDGAAWVAERQHPNVAQSTNRILKISPAGQVLQTVGLPYIPFCLRVDRSDGSVWVTGVTAQPSLGKRILDTVEKRTGQLPTGKWLRDTLTKPNVLFRTQKYDSSGVLQRTINQGGFSFDIDRADGSLWLGGYDRTYHYSPQGKALGRSSRGAVMQKYVAVVPDSTEPKEQPAPTPHP